MNDDADIWAAFASTPPYVEPVANRDNSLAGFQRRLLEEAGYKLEQATVAMTDYREQVEELRTRYLALFEQASDADRLIQATAAKLRRLAEIGNIAGLSDILTDLEAWLDG